MSQITNISGSWSDRDNAWVSEALQLSDESFLEVEFEQNGIVVIKLSDTQNGPWPKAYISKWRGPKQQVRLYGTTKDRYIKVFLSRIPKSVQLSSITTKS